MSKGFLFDDSARSMLADLIMTEARRNRREPREPESKANTFSPARMLLFGPNSGPNLGVANC